MSLNRVQLVLKMQLLSLAHLYPCTSLTLYEKYIFSLFSIMERIRKGSDLPKKSGGHRASNKNIRTTSLSTPNPKIFYSLKGARSRYFRYFCLILSIMSSKCQIGRARVFHLQNQGHITTENDFFRRFSNLPKCNPFQSPVLSIHAPSWLSCVSFEFFYSLPLFLYFS